MVYDKIEMTDLRADFTAAIPEWFKPPRGIDEIRKCYGDIVVVNGEIVSPPHWESSNMLMAHEDWIPNKILYVNKKVWPILRATIEACLALNDGYVIRTLGCFSPRAKRVNGDLSTHSWGIAVDLNASKNPLQDSRESPLITDIPKAWVDSFCGRGWTAGINFKGRRDPQHFQYASSY